MVAGTGIGSQQIRDGKAPYKNSQGCEILISQTPRKSRWCVKNFAWVAKFLHTLRNFRNPHVKSVGSTSNDHNFLVRTPISAFLDSIESSLSINSNHMRVNSIWCSHIWVILCSFQRAMLDSL